MPVVGIVRVARLTGTFTIVWMNDSQTDSGLADGTVMYPARHRMKLATGDEVQLVASMNKDVERLG